MGEIAISLGSIFGIVLLLSSLLACVVTVLLFTIYSIVSRGRYETPGEAWSSLVTLLLGSPGKSWVGPVMVIGIYMGVLWILAPSLQIWVVQWSDFPGTLALVLGHGICVMMVGIFYRLFIMKWPEWRGHHWVFAVAVSGLVYFLVSTPIGVAPFSWTVNY
jgi:hypothetical protein